MFVSESGICRGPLAAAAFSHLLQHSPLKDILRVDMRVSHRSASHCVKGLMSHQCIQLFPCASWYHTDAG
jgi:protein-tyrosine-phosphatase